MFMVNKDY